METKIECAIHNAKMRLKQTEREIMVLEKIKESQYHVISDLENIESDKLLK